MKITTKQIAAFVALADQQNFTRAARMLNITQPSLSATIRDLEGALGMPIFDRTTRDVSLNTVGRQLLPVVRRIHADINLLLSTSSDFAQLSQGRVRVACSNVIAVAQLIPLASRFERKFSSIKIEVVDTVEQSLATLVRSEEVDFAIATEVDPEPRLVQTRLAEDRLAVYVPAGHRLAEHEAVTWADLKSEPLALLHKGNPLRKLVDRTAGRLGIWLTVANEVSFGATALALAERGLAVTILPTNAQQANATYSCRMKPLVKPSVTRRVVILSLAGRSLSPAAAEFKAVCAKEFPLAFDQPR